MSVAPFVGSAPFVRPLSLVTRAELRELRKISIGPALALVAHAYAVMALAIAVFVIWPNAMTFILAVMIVGSRQLGLLYLMHEGAHGLLAEDDRINVWIGQWLCAYPNFACTMEYRQKHLTHHANTLQSDDPDLHQTADYPVTRRDLVRTFALDLIGITAVKERILQFRDAWGGAELSARQHLARFWDKLGGALIANSVLFALFAASGYWELYFLFWLLPMLTWHRVARTVQTLASHAVISDPNNPYTHARTTLVGPIGRLLFFPYYSNYHLDHHLISYVPCYRMQRLHALLMAGDSAGKLEIGNGLVEVLRRISSKPEGDAALTA